MIFPIKSVRQLRTVFKNLESYRLLVDIVVNSFTRDTHTLHTGLTSFDERLKATKRLSSPS